MRVNAEKMERITASALQRRLATAEDLPFLYALRTQTMDAHQIAAGLMPSQEHHLRRIMLHFDCAQILVLSGERVGLLKVVREALAWELLQIQLMPSLQGKGLGGELVSEVIQQARSAGASLSLSVLRGSPAKNLYDRLGFVVTASSEHSYEMLLAYGKHFIA